MREKGCDAPWSRRASYSLWFLVLLVQAGLGALPMPPDPASRPAGTVVSWGRQVIPFFEPGARYFKIAGGLVHSLALRSDGTVVAWGENFSGQCMVPAGLSGVVAIAAGGSHSLALKSDGTVAEWGKFWNGSTLVNVAVPINLNDVRTIAAGAYHSLALKSDGTVVAWGANDVGQSMVPSSLSGVVAIAGGGFHNLALKSDGTLVAWGHNPFGQCSVPTGLSGVVAIEAGTAHSLALKSDGKVVAWGANDYGQSTVPAGLSGVVAIAAGDSHSLALKSDGTVVAWGLNDFGQSTVPITLNGVMDLAAGGLHSMALRNNGTVEVWGDNDYGQSTVPTSLIGVVAIAGGGFHNLALKGDGTVVAWGMGTTVGANAPHYGQSLVPTSLRDVISITAGVFHSLALKKNGTVVAWGGNSSGQCTVPSDLGGVVAIAAGSYHSLALKDDGTIVIWGSQLLVPTELSGVVSIAAGGGHNLALKSDGKVVAWGANDYGQSTVPAGLSGVVAIAAGSTHSLALKSDGAIMAWGKVWNGSTYVDAAVPIEISGVVAIEAGAAYSLALKSDGTVVAWGWNGFGQINVLEGLSGVVGIATGSESSLAVIRSSGLPIFSLQPNNQTVRAGMGATFTASVSGLLPMGLQWQFNNAPIAGATSATLTLNNVQPRNAGRYSVRVVNAVGSAVSRTATLAILADPANGTPSTPVATPSAPPKDASHDSLVVVTHGWQPTELLFPDVRWIDDMATTIRQKLVGQANWQVRAIDWKELAFWPEPEVPLFYAKIIGNLLGRQVGSQAWSRVHLIGHSAGSAMIQEAARRIKIASPTTTVHTTFLDPYFGVLYYENRQLYGQDADWSDAYFARDISGPFTSAVPHSHSVDVTSLDPEPSRSPLHYFRLHGWPYDFYMRTVTNGFSTAQGDTSLGYGFPLSMEGGGWANRGSFPVGNTPVVLSGVPPITSPTDLPANTRLELNLTKLPVSGGNYTVSTPATAQINGDLFQFQNGGSLTPQSVRDSVGSTTGRAVQSLVPASVPVLEPAWVSIGVTVTNLVNYVKFDASFTSAAGAQGLFSVYWGTNLLGALDERAADTGLQTYRFLLPEAYTNGTYSLGFRLDAYTTTPSSLTLTNVMTGFIGITNPPALSVAPSATNGPAQITLTGATGFYSLLQSSTDLTNWISIATLVNSNGLVQFSDPGSTNQTRRYYRAVVP